MKYIKKKGAEGGDILEIISRLISMMNKLLTDSEKELAQTFGPLCETISTLASSKDIALIKEWIGGTIGFKLIFKATKDGFGAADFHKLCNGVAPLLIIIKTNFGKLIGGYTILSYNSTGGWIVDNSSKCFLFSLTLGKKYPMISTANTIYDGFTYGPTFGVGHDLCLVNNCNTASGSYCNMGTSYTKENPTSFAGAKNFTVVDYEVFKVL